MRTIFVGDIHGCLEEFNELLSRVAFRQGEDRLVLVGDLMDRGPDPVGVVHRARDLDAVCVLGNHDEKHLRWHRHEAKKRMRPGYKNPMRPFDERRLAETEALGRDGIAWLSERPIFAQIGSWVAVHAGFEPGLPFNEQRDEKMMRVRYVDGNGKMVPITNDIDQPGGTRRWAEAYQQPQHVVYGHHAGSLSKPRIDVYESDAGMRWMRYGIDTGCCFGGHLTALVVPDLNEAEQVEWVQVQSKGTYADVWHGDPS